MSSEKGKQIFFKKKEPKTGYDLLVSKNNSYLNDLQVYRLRLDKRGSIYKGKTGAEELLIEILIGKCDVIVKYDKKIKKFKEIGDRKNVFEKEPTGLLVGPNSEFEIICASTSVDILLPRVKLTSSSSYAPVLIKSENVEVYEIGEGNFKRKVRVVLGGNGPSKRLRGGETINSPGQWSSWPRHSFDNHPELAAQFEEFFIYFTRPKEGWALQRCDGIFVDGKYREQSKVVRNGDYAVLPLGDHPIAAAPDTMLLYIWFYVSPVPKIYPKWAEDHGEYA